MAVVLHVAGGAVSNMRHRGRTVHLAEMLLKSHKNHGCGIEADWVHFRFFLLCLDMGHGGCRAPKKRALVTTPAFTRHFGLSRNGITLSHYFTSYLLIKIFKNKTLQKSKSSATHSLFRAVCIFSLA